MSNLRIVEFNSIREHGQMNKNFYPKDMDNAEKTRLIREHKQNLVGDIGLSYKDISDITKTSLGTVKSRIARARDIVQIEIEKYQKS